MRRRELISILGAGATAAQLDAFQHAEHEIRTKPAEYKLQFFSEAENRTLDELAEMILPADERSPGARAAKVSLYIDLVVANSAPDARREWKSGLAAFDQSGGRPFLDLAPKDRAALLDRLSAANSPDGAARRFFVKMKRLTLFGYYTSEIGYRQELQRKGPEVLDRFPGACPHPPGTHA